MLTTTAQHASPASQPRRADPGDQLELLRTALADAAIDPALPYASQVARILRNAIVTLRLMPGTPLSEAALAETLSISRTPIREALKYLATEQLLDIFPQAGTVVAPIRLHLIEQSAFVRNAMESANLMDLVNMLDAKGRQRIQALLDLQAKALSAQDAAQFFVHDEAMHRLFFELTHRLPVWDLVHQGKQHVDRARQLLIRNDQATISRAYEEHLTITRALFDQDATQLALAMQQHVLRIPQHVVAYARKIESSFIIP